MANYLEPLSEGAVGSASRTMNSKRQMALLDQTKTVSETAIQLVYTAKEGGGNPKVRTTYPYPTQGCPNSAPIYISHYIYKRQ